MIQSPGRIGTPYSSLCPPLIEGTPGSEKPAGLSVSPRPSTGQPNGLKSCGATTPRQRVARAYASSQ